MDADDKNKIVKNDEMKVIKWLDKSGNANSLYSYTMQELLDELDIIERYEQPGKRYYLGEITNKQKELFNNFNIDSPI